MFRRVQLHRARDLDELQELVAAVPRPITMIFDADNTLVPQEVSLERFQQGVTTAIHRFETLASVTRVIVLTNGPERGVPGMIHRGNKPWTTRRRLGLRSRTDVWVVGDQLLTDGILAWRFGAGPRARHGTRRPPASPGSTLTVDAAPWARWYETWDMYRPHVPGSTQRPRV